MRRNLQGSAPDFTATKPTRRSTMRKQIAQAARTNARAERQGFNTARRKSTGGGGG